MRIVASIALLVLTACSRVERPGSASIPIFIISIDTLRSDRVGAYGYGAASTPVLDRFRIESILFERAFSHVPLTLPSHATLFSGTLPPAARVRDNLGYVFPQNVDTLPQILKSRGYATGAAVSSYVLRRTTGISRGFDFYDDEAEKVTSAGPTAAERDGERSRQLLEGWLSTISGEAVFGFLHLYEPHAPYEPPRDYVRPDPYDGEVAYADAIVGRFFDALRRRDLYDRALIVILSDHGEGLGQHGEDEHGLFVYRESIQIPLMIKLPRGARGGTVVGKPAGLFDVAPTVLTHAGIDVPSAMQGVDVLSATLPSRQIYSETYYPRLHFGWHELRALLDERFHYIDAPKRELYDYVADPGEEKSILAEQRRTAAAMAGILDAIPPAFTLPAVVDPEERSRLAALGYIGSTIGSGENLPDPKDNIQFVRLFARAAQAFDKGRDGEALELLRTLTTESPNMVEAWALLARTYRRLGQSDRALEALRNAMNRFPQHPFVALALADLLLTRGDLKGAREHALLVVSADPIAANELLAEIALKSGAVEEAGGHAMRALQVSPHRVSALRLLARIHRRQNRHADELALLDQVVEQIGQRSLAPLPGVQYERGNALLQLGRGGEAELAFSAETRDFPDNARAWGNLALVRAARGDIGAARSTVDEMLQARSDGEARRVAAEVLKVIQENAPRPPAS